MLKMSLSAAMPVLLATLIWCQPGFSQDENPNAGDRPRSRSRRTITPEALLDRFDTNKDGKLTKDEIPEQAQRLQQMMKDADKDRDGTITKKEITQYLANGGGQGGRPQAGAGRPQQRGSGRGGFSANLPKVGRPLPNLTVFDGEGKEFKLSSLKQHYTVLVFGCLT
ncbi:MAG: EF-hand domain-containing protein [Planctomycetaceae bacterium]|jgi:hypothetical protein|nr:EF-hand domain-containing protein [Planctomycetaceae bacterium]MBT6156433.1 EF-hand domain-containing protein [Planctomycetaceae bacterium]MBT6485490.1 EF-hand domain-containing protein [Planctomycetaceae bacterium]MBT6497286.1 EF-hand domain-containing protein [Planctomycetaceae bacterium]